MPCSWNWNSTSSKIEYTLVQKIFTIIPSIAIPSLTLLICLTLMNVIWHLSLGNYDVCRAKLQACSNLVWSMKASLDFSITEYLQTIFQVFNLKFFRMADSKHAAWAITHGLRLVGAFESDKSIPGRILPQTRVCSYVSYDLKNIHMFLSRIWYQFLAFFIQPSSRGSNLP